MSDRLGYALIHLAQVLSLGHHVRTWAAVLHEEDG